MTPQRIFITGASAGIGQALAEHYAAQHHAAAHARGMHPAASLTLGLVARRTERIEALAERLRGHGAVVHTYSVDVRERQAMAEAAAGFVAAADGISLVIANAGQSRSDRLAQGSAEDGAETIAINVAGVLHTLHPFVPTMLAQGHGHLVAIGSVAGFRGIPGKGAYCASKAAVKTLMDAWRPELRQHGIRISTICPGWVVSEMTEHNPYPMPFLMETAKAARLTANAIARGRSTYVFPWQMRLLVPILRALPERLMPMHATRS